MSAPAATSNWTANVVPTPTSLSPGISLTNTHGALLLGTFVGVILYGMGIHQSSQYCRLFGSDTVVMKLLVILVMLLETVHVIVTVHTSYYYLVSSYLNPVALMHGVWSLNILPLVSGVLMFISQLFFAYRVSLTVHCYSVGRPQRVVVTIAVLLLMGEVGFSIAATAKAFTIPSYQETKDVTYLSGVGLALAMAGDAALTTTLVHAFCKSRSASPRRERIAPATDNSALQDMKAGLETNVPLDEPVYGPGSEPASMADLLQLYVVNTGLLTGLFNLAALTAAFARPSDFIYASINIITTRLYGNSLLAVLNTRQASLAGMEIFVDSSSTISLADAQIAQSRLNWNVPLTWKEAGPPQIRVDVTTETDGPRQDGGLMKRLTGSLSVRRGSHSIV
ncbi:hypothetical protein C8Q80DRAFT_656152 [Daedaleopsis nitida]|nr:hypothetical protein C8Q80DRAFT_656152 [Daedaleopsis nitida]